MAGREVTKELKVDDEPKPKIKTEDEPEVRVSDIVKFDMNGEGFVGDDAKEWKKNTMDSMRAQIRSFMKEERCIEIGIDPHSYETWECPPNFEYKVKLANYIETNVKGIVVIVGESPTPVGAHITLSAIKTITKQSEGPRINLLYVTPKQEPVQQYKYVNFRMESKGFIGGSAIQWKEDTMARIRERIRIRMERQGFANPREDYRPPSYELWRCPPDFDYKDGLYEDVKANVVGITVRENPPKDKAFITLWSTRIRNNEHRNEPVLYVMRKNVSERRNSAYVDFNMKSKNCVGEDALQWKDDTMTSIDELIRDGRFYPTMDIPPPSNELWQCPSVFDYKTTLTNAFNTNDVDGVVVDEQPSAGAYITLRSTKIWNNAHENIVLYVRRKEEPAQSTD